MLVHNMRGHTILKDAKSGKCLDINKTHLEIYGAKKSQDIIGYTVWDINNFMSKMWLDNAQQVAKFDEEVIYTQKPVIKPMRIWLNAQGKVWAHYMSKYPVINDKHQVIAILGTSEDLTSSVPLNKLYQYYCHFYHERKIAITMFLKHINIFNLFHTLPTHAEIIILITKKSHIQNKLVAQYLNISIGTVESHINKLIHKLNIPIPNLQDILFKIIL